MFINSQFTWDYDSQMTEKYFVEYTGIEVKQFRETLLLHMGTSKWPVPFVRYNWTAQLMSLLMKLNGIMSNLNHICHISVGKDAPEFCEFFEINDLKAQLQAKTTLICNLKNQIKSVKEASNEAKNEKLNKENEHLKQTFKELYDSIKKTQIQTRDHNDSLIAQVNSKTVENGDLKAQIQEKVQSIKTRNNNKLVEPKSHTQKPGRQIAIGQRFFLNKSSAVHEKPNTPRSCLRWIPTGRIFKLVGLRWIPTGKMFIDSTTKVDSLALQRIWRLQTTLQAPLLKEKKGVRFSALYLRKKRNLLVFDHSYQHDSCFFYARSVIKWINYFNPLPSVVQHVLVDVVQEPVVSTGTPSSTRIDQDTLYKNLVLEDSLPVQDGNGEIGYCNEGNNMYRFPGIGLGTLLSRARIISDGKLQVAAEWQVFYLMSNS
ncbi:kinase-like domain-containing protein [Tanacetum coccineum]